MKNLTPEHMRCGGSNSSCPSVHEMDDGRLMITGELQHMHAMTGKTEATIIIDRALLANVLGNKEGRG